MITRCLILARSPRQSPWGGSHELCRESEEAWMQWFEGSNFYCSQAALTRAEAAAQGSEPLRLRGGGRRKRDAGVAAAEPDRVSPPASAAASAAARAAADAAAFAIGSAVEATNDENGLRGCWYAACSCHLLPATVLLPCFCLVAHRTELIQNCESLCR